MNDYRGAEVMVGDKMQTVMGRRRANMLTHVVLKADETRGAYFADYHGLWVAPEYLARYWQHCNIAASDLDTHHKAELAPIVQICLHDRANGTCIFDHKMFDLITLTGKLGSINQATKVMGLSYSYAWNRIARIEDWLGIEFFDRQGPRGSTLTEEGTKFIKGYNRVFVHTKQCVDEVVAETLKNKDQSMRLD